MTTSSIKLAPPNSLVFIEDAGGGVVPTDFKPGSNILSTDTCIAVCCLAEMDGQTHVTIGPAQEIDPGEKPAFDVTLATPTRAVVVTTVELVKLLEASVPSIRTRIRIWTNRAKEPDDVIVGLG